jgi:hypothetical protein
MKKGVMLLLPYLAACMGGTTTEVLSEGGIAPTEATSDYVPVNPPGEPFLGHVSFGLLLNDERALGGVRLVEENAYLNAAASAHAQDMVTHDYLSHTGRDGSTPGDRAAAAGYEWSYISENIARGFTTEAGVIEGWMNSPGHRTNMLDERAEDFGLGRINTTWVLMLGAQM